MLQRERKFMNWTHISNKQHNKFKREQFSFLFLLLLAVAMLHSCNSYKTIKRNQAYQHIKTYATNATYKVKILNHFLSLTPFTTNRMKSKLTRSQTHINNLEWRSYWIYEWVCRWRKFFRKKFFGQWTWFGKSKRFWNDPKNPFQLLIFSSFAKSFTPKKIIRKIDFFQYFESSTIPV